MKLTVAQHITNNPTKRDPQVYLRDEDGYNVGRMDVAGRNPTRDPYQTAQDIANAYNERPALLARIKELEGHLQALLEWAEPGPDDSYRILVSDRTAIAAMVAIKMHDACPDCEGKGGALSHDEDGDGEWSMAVDRFEPCANCLDSDACPGCMVKLTTEEAEQARTAEDFSCPVCCWHYDPERFAPSEPDYYYGD